MSPTWRLLILLPAAYLIGSVPFGLLVGFARGIDVRKAGSGNIGATNVGRLLGRRFFTLVFVLDLLKGFVPALLASAVLGWQSARWQENLLWLLVASGAVIGHMFSIFLRFRGGKGVATGFGVALGIFPYYTIPALIAVAVWLALFKTRGYVSLASVVAAAVFPAAYIVLGLIRRWGVFANQWPLLVFCLLLSAAIIYKHRGNIARLRAGTENRA